MDKILSFLLIFSLLSCEPGPTDIPSPDPDPKEEPVASSPYFPPADESQWEVSPPDSLGWDPVKLDNLYDFLQQNNTRAFIILKEGRIVVEKYWGKNLQGSADFDQSSSWYWASAGKTLTAFLVGMAQEEGLLDIHLPTSTYLGTGWTSLGSSQEEAITPFHQLTMTTGLNVDNINLDCTDPSCLTFETAPGDQWYYHNAPYTLLSEVVAAAAGSSYNTFTDQKLENKIGMSGSWIKTGFNNVYFSKARDAARFGWLILNKGKWGEELIMNDSSYFQAMVNSSQSLNPSYGYLWWLNGKSSVIFPGFKNPINISLAPSAPSDLVAALGKNGQFVEVVPSLDLVLVRMGEAPDNALVPIQFHDDMWKELSDIVVK